MRSGSTELTHAEEFNPVDLPTYTNIWRIEKRLYKLYDFRLPAPLPITWIAVFAGITVPYVVFLIAVGLPFNHNLVWLYVLPPGVLTWLCTRPVIENKRLPELVTSQVRYLSEPRSWCRMAPFSEKDEIYLSARTWHRYPPKPKKVTAKTPVRARLSRAAAASAGAGTIQLDDILLEGAEFDVPQNMTAQSDATLLEAPRAEAPPLDLPASDLISSDRIKPATTESLKSRLPAVRLPQVRRPATRHPAPPRPPVVPPPARPDAGLAPPVTPGPMAPPAQAAPSPPAPSLPAPAQAAPVQPAPAQPVQAQAAATPADEAASADRTQVPVRERSGPPRIPGRGPVQPRRVPQPQLPQPKRGQEQPPAEDQPSAGRPQSDRAFSWSPWPGGSQLEPDPSATSNAGTTSRPAWMVAPQPETSDPRALELSHEIDPEGQSVTGLSAGPASRPSAGAGVWT